MWKKKKQSWGVAILLLTAAVVLGYYIGGLFLYQDLSLDNFQQYLSDIFRHPFRNYWNEKTVGCIYLAVFGCLCLIMYYSYYNRNFLNGREHGSAEWASYKDIMASKGDQNGRIVSQHISLSRDGQKIANNNMMVIGAPGTGKSFRIVGPNLLKTQASVVVLDVKGDLLRKYGKALEGSGATVKCLDLISSDFGLSHCYNPFRYIKTEVDLIRLVTNIQTSVTPPDALKGDPFWEDGVTLYLMACFYYVWMEMDYPSLPKVQILMNEESHVIDEETGETELERRMNRLSALSKMESNHPAVTNYRKLKEGAPDTVKSIIIMCNAKFKFMGVAAAQRIFRDDEMDLQDLGIGVHGDGKTRTALFLCIPDDDRSFDFVIGMLYTQLFQVLIEQARTAGGSLPIPVEVWMDEFANGARPTGFEKLITTLRSRNISVIMFLQSVSQLKEIYKNDTWEILMDACSVLLYLGGGRGAYSTHEYISKLLGSATIDKKNDGIHKGSNGSSNMNFDRQARELMTSEEISRMPDHDCIIFIQGERPVYDKKFRTQDMKEFKAAMKMGDYVPDVKIKKTEEGEYITIKPEGQIIPLNKESVEFYKGQAQNNQNIKVFEITEDEFLNMDFSDNVPEISAEMLNDLVRNRQLDFSEEYAGEPDLQPWDLSGTIFECINRYYNRLSAEQKEEILLGLEAGLSEDDVKEYFTLNVEDMRIHRRVKQLQIS